MVFHSEVVVRRMNKGNFTEKPYCPVFTPLHTWPVTEVAMIACFGKSQKLLNIVLRSVKGFQVLLEKKLV